MLRIRLGPGEIQSLCLRVNVFHCPCVLWGWLLHGGWLMSQSVFQWGGMKRENSLAINSTAHLLNLPVQSVTSPRHAGGDGNSGGRHVVCLNPNTIQPPLTRKCTTDVCVTFRFVTVKCAISAAVKVKRPLHRWFANHSGAEKGCAWARVCAQAAAFLSAAPTQRLIPMKNVMCQLCNCVCVRAACSDV